MKIILAQEAGFCFGVRRALQMAEKASKVPGTVRTLGPIIHNPQVVARLAARGVESVNSLDQVADDATVLIRTHGVSPDVFEDIRERNLGFVDTTCPFVRRAQNLARSMVEDGRCVVVVGERGHPEVEGIRGWSQDHAVVVSGPEEVRECNLGNRVGVISQTTQGEDNFLKVVEVLKACIPDLDVHNTICGATRERQQAALELAGRVDVMVVIGGRESANTRKLVTICHSTGVPTFHVEQAEELCAAWFIGVRCAGVTAGASTPDWIIEEVVARMTEFNEEKLQGEENQEQEKQVEEQASNENEPILEEHREQASNENEPTLPEHSEQAANETYKNEVELSLEESLRQLRRGDIVNGTVIQVSENEVIVDVGGKSEGVIPLSELSHRSVDDPREVVEVGQTIEVYVLKTENEEGHPVLSKKRADRKVAWEKLEASKELGSEISATVTEVVKGGLLVDVGVRGFVPASQVERGYVENLDTYLGKPLRLRVIELDRGKNKVVLSQKAILEEEYKSIRQETWANLEKDQIRHGIVRRLTNFGAFVDIGGVDGLLHVSELSWGRVDHPRDVLTEGQEIDVIVLGVDNESEKVSLGLKQMRSNPWYFAAENYPPGSIVQGKVLRLAPFGAFVEVEPGVEGLVHISQLADYRVAKTEDVVSVGDEIPVKVLSVDQEAQRMSLSLKDALGTRQSGGHQQHMQAQENKDDEYGVKLGDLFGDLFDDDDEG